MAVTKIKAIRGTLSKAIAYILNPEKTDEKLLVSSYGCASETAAREFEWTRKIAEQNLQVDLILLLDEFDYPPVTIDDVYKEVLEQAENFKKYAQ